MTTRKFSELRAQMSPESRERAAAKAEAMMQEMALAELRRAHRMSRTELARVLGVRPPGVADIEKRTDMYISTLRGLVEDMGGELEIVARFPGGREVRIRNFVELEEA